MKIEKTCPSCEGQFITSEWRIRHGQGKCCSVVCATKLSSHLQTRIEKIVQERGPICSSEIGEILGCSINSISQSRYILVRKGKIHLAKWRRMDRNGRSTLIAMWGIGPGKPAKRPKWNQSAAQARYRAKHKIRQQLLDKKRHGSEITVWTQLGIR